MSDADLTRIASRGSRLALAQAEMVRRRLSEAWPDRRFEIVTIQTRGDREIDRPLPEIGGKGLFTEALEGALERGQVDLAVHSLKDLPTDLPPGLSVGAVPEREDARDAWVAAPDGPPHPRAAPEGFRVGTSSERRRAQLLALRPDLQVGPVRGNVETRVRKLDAGEHDALLMAVAGLVRLGLGARVTARLEAPEWLSAPGQGAVAVECRSGDEAIEALLAPIDDRVARAETEAERALLATLQGGCQVPIGARARVVRAEQLELSALVARPDGSRVVRAEGHGRVDAPRELGERLAERLLLEGAATILAELRQAGSEAGP